MLNVSICVSTFGNFKWKLLAQERALPNARSFGVPVIYNHVDAPDSLHVARNLGLAQVETAWVCFLDADDELAPGFFEEMEKVEGDLRPPSVNHVHEGVTFMPRVVGKNGVHNHMCVADCLLEGNFLCIGTVVRTELLRAVGGWKNYSNFEDYDAWMRCWLAGGTVTPVPRAIYQSYSTAQGRCRNMSVKEGRMVQYDIAKTNMPEKDWEWLLRI